MLTCSPVERIFVMASSRSFVHHEQVDAQYLEQRQLKPKAGWILLWALGVGAVISGDYGGWNIGLHYAGFYGMLVGVFLMAVMYICMVFTIAELSSALPHAGGFFSFTRHAFGPLGGFICGLTDTIEYVITPAVIVYFIGGYMEQLLPQIPVQLWWCSYYVVFIAINVRGVELTLKVGLVITAIAAMVLVIFYTSAIVSGAFQPELLFVDTDGKTTDGFVDGWRGVLRALPFAIWFYLAIEQLPLAAEESRDVVRDMPRALILGILTLLLLSLFTLVLNSGVGEGAGAIGKSDAPLGDGFKAVFGDNITSTLLIIIALTGLVASFHTIIYAYGRVLFALSRAGYIPRWISVTGKNHTPVCALILGGIVGLGCAWMIAWQGGKGIMAAALLNMAVFGAVLSYAMVMASYIKLHFTHPHLKRPYRSPFGVPGAVVGLLLALLALLSTFTVTDLRAAIMGTIVFLCIGIVYFFFYSRHHLVAQAPEEELSLLTESTDTPSH